MLVLHTYTPNSGDATNPVHLARRRDWDCELRTWLSSATIKASKPVVYCGDLNVVSRVLRVYLSAFLPFCFSDFLLFCLSSVLFFTF